MGWFSSKPPEWRPLTVTLTVLRCAKCGAQGHVDFPPMHVGPRGGGQELPAGARPVTEITIKGRLKCACCGAERQMEGAE